MSATAALLSLQRSSGNAAVARMLREGGSGALLARQKNLAGPSPPTADDGKQLEADRLVDDVLRDKTEKLALLAYSTYEAAAVVVREEVRLRQAAAKKADDDKWSMIVAVGMALVPPEALFAAAMRATVVSQFEEALKARALKEIESGKAWGMTETILHDFVPKITDKRLEAGYKAVQPLLPLLKASVSGNDVGDRTVAMLDKCAASANDATKSVLVSAKLSRDQMLGLWAAYAQPSLREVFIGHLSALAKHFETQVAPQGITPRLFHAKIDAYGRPRWALFRRPNLSDPILPLAPLGPQFVEWVTPDLEAMVAAQNPKAETVYPELVDGHIPNPVTEVERTVWINAWGRKRLAVVHGEAGKTHFVRWFQESEYTRAQAAAEAQEGGLVELSQDDVLDKTKPPDA